MQLLDSNTDCSDIYEAHHNINGFPPIPSCTLIYSLYISYLSLLDKLPSQFSVLKQHSLSHGFWGSWCGSSLPGWFCLRFSHEVAVELLARDAVFWSLNWNWKVYFQEVLNFSLGVSWSLITSPHGPLHRVANYLPDMNYDFRQNYEW